MEGWLRSGTGRWRLTTSGEGMNRILNRPLHMPAFLLVRFMFSTGSLTACLSSLRRSLDLSKLQGWCALHVTPFTHSSLHALARAGCLGSPCKFLQLRLVFTG